MGFKRMGSNFSTSVSYRERIITQLVPFAFPEFDEFRQWFTGSHFIDFLAVSRKRGP